MPKLILGDLPIGKPYTYRDKLYSIDIDVEQVLNPGGHRCRNCCFTGNNCTHILNQIFGYYREACNLSVLPMPRVFREVK